MIIFARLASLGSLRSARFGGSARSAPPCGHHAGTITKSLGRSYYFRMLREMVIKMSEDTFAGEVRIGVSSGHSAFIRACDRHLLKVAALP